MRTVFRLRRASRPLRGLPPAGRGGRRLSATAAWASPERLNFWYNTRQREQRKVIRYVDPMLQAARQEDRPGQGDGDAQGCRGRLQGELRPPQEALRDVRRLYSATKNGTPGLTTWGSVFLRSVSLALHLSALLSSGVVLLEAHCGCGVPCARTPPVLRLSHRLSFRRACCHSPTHLQPSFNRHTNHLSIAFQPPPTRSSPAPPPIRRDKAGHPHLSHTATKPNAQTLQPQLSHTARPTVPYEQF